MNLVRFLLLCGMISNVYAFKVAVKHITGIPFTVEIENNTTVFELKDKIYVKYAVKVNKILEGGKELLDDHQLKLDDLRRIPYLYAL